MAYASEKKISGSPKLKSRLQKRPSRPRRRAWKKALPALRDIRRGTENHLAAVRVESFPREVESLWGLHRVAISRPVDQTGLGRVRKDFRRVRQAWGRDPQAVFPRRALTVL